MQRRIDFTESDQSNQRPSFIESLRADATEMRRIHPFDLRFPLISIEYCKGHRLEGIFSIHQAFLHMGGSVRGIFPRYLIAVDAQEEERLRH